MLKRLQGCVLAFVGLLALSGLAGAHETTQRIRGDVIAASGHVLEVRADNGRVIAVRLADNLRVSARSAANLAAIAPGAFIGTTAIAQPDATLLASEVHAFPESMRGTGEGHRPMDATTGTTMTNATVTDVAATGKARAQSTMTNATVAGVTGNGAGRRVTLKYKDGEKVVIVGDTVPVVMVEPGDSSMLVPGTHVVVIAAKQPDGTLTADRITVGKNGLVPPV